jgi:hypothetical protein
LFTIFHLCGIFTISKVYLNLLDEALQNEGASISHFNLSHSGRTLTLAGNRLLRLYSVSLAATGTVELDDLDPQQVGCWVGYSSWGKLPF